MGRCYVDLGKSENEIAAGLQPGAVMMDLAVDTSRAM